MTCSSRLGLIDHYRVLICSDVASLQQFQRRNSAFTCLEVAGSPYFIVQNIQNFHVVHRPRLPIVGKIFVGFCLVVTAKDTVAAQAPMSQFVLALAQR